MQIITIKRMNKTNEFIAQLKDYADRYIVTDYYNSTIIEEGRKLVRNVERHKNRSFCSQHIDTKELCELDYWHEIVRLVYSRMESKNKTVEESWFMSYNSIRYLYTGMPMIVYPSWGTNLIKSITLILFFASATMQIIRVQIDGGLSLYAQILYALGAVVSIIYFSSVGNFDFIVPQVGAFVVALVSVVGIFRHSESPWASL